MTTAALSSSVSATTPKVSSSAGSQPSADAKDFTLLLSSALAQSIYQTILGFRNALQSKQGFDDAVAGTRKEVIVSQILKEVEQIAPDKLQTVMQQIRQLQNGKNDAAKVEQEVAKLCIRTAGTQALTNIVSSYLKMQFKDPDNIPLVGLKRIELVSANFSALHAKLSS